MVGSKVLVGSLVAFWKRARARLTSRPDTEHEQALIRLLNAVLLGIYLAPEILQPTHAIAWSVYFLSGLAIVASIFLFPGISPVRRTLGALADISALTWVLIHFGVVGAPLFLAYLWITLANGFRFGARYLVASLAMSAAGFGIALATSPFWIANRELGIGLLIGLVLLSLYVRKLVTQLFDAIARAEAANQAKRRFISVVSHEMRTPLNAIIGMADLMRDTSLNREQADMLQTLRSSSRMMLGLVEDVLDFSKIEAGKLVVSKSDFDLHALVNSTSRIVGSQAAAKGVDFVVSIMPEVPPALRGDPHYLRQVLVNLAGNAVKFTERGSVTLHVSALDETEAGVIVKFSIRDTGIGIPPEALDRIFESFTQADQSTTRRFGGTGLGTTIAKQLVGLMGGKIGVESSVGLGSTFWFELRLDKQPGRQGTASGDLANSRVLLIGFPAPDREALEEALGVWGAKAFAVDTLEGGATRLVSEISIAKPYHSVLLFATSDALALVRRLRRTVPDPVPPAILAVPAGMEVARFDALSAGYAAILELPLDKRLLFNVLHSVAAQDEISEGVLRLQDYAHKGARKLRVLLADDNPTNRQVLGKIIERGGHAAVIVNDGEQALDAVERERFDVVILDRNMPGIGGIEALQALRLMTRGRDRIPVIVLSADATEEARREAMEAGADGFLAKPIEAMRLLDEIHTQAAGLDKRTEREVAPRPASQHVADQVVNHETLSRLEDLGSSPGFVERLIGVFTADYASLLERMEKDLAGRSYHLVRAHLHAMKGSSASMGTERLTALCSRLGMCSDAELRLQGPKMLRELSEELAAASDQLNRYVSERQQTTG